jgi:Transketolase, thiamine diphosphate binding domain
LSADKTVQLAINTIRSLATSEAASVAGHLRLSNLCWIYDSNRVTIEGHTKITFTEDVAARFLAYGWEVMRVTDPNDIESGGRERGPGSLPLPGEGTLNG